MTKAKKQAKGKRIDEAAVAAIVAELKAQEAADMDAKAQVEICLFSAKGAFSGDSVFSWLKAAEAWEKRIVGVADLLANPAAYDLGPDEAEAVRRVLAERGAA